MDEFDKENGLNQEGEKYVPKTADEEHENALNKELEDIRDMFQKELDKEAEGGEQTAEDSDGEDANSSGQLIQELEEEVHEQEEPEEKPSDEDLCKCCGKNRRDTSFGDDYPYCTTCRDLMKANPFNFIGVVAMVLVVVFTGFVTGLFTKIDYDTLNTLLDANMSYEEGNLYAAESSYQSYFSSANKNNISFRAVRNTADIYARLGYFSYAAQTVDSYASKFQMSLPWNSKLKEYAKMQEDFSKAQNLLSENFPEVLNNLDFDKDEQVKKYEELLKTEKEKGENGRYAVTYLMYVRYVIESRTNADGYDEQLKILKEIEQSDTNNFGILYYQDLLNLYAKKGDVDNAQLYFDKLSEISGQEGYAYNYLADAMIRSGKADADKLLELAESAKAATPSNSFPQYHRIYAAAYLIGGKYDDALKSAKEYYDAYISYAQAPTAVTSNLYALCAVAAGDNTTYKNIQSESKKAGITLSKLISSYKSGKMTIVEVLSDNGGEF